MTRGGEPSSEERSANQVAPREGTGWENYEFKREGKPNMYVDPYTNRTHAQTNQQNIQVCLDVTPPCRHELLERHVFHSMFILMNATRYLVVVADGGML